MQSRSLKKLIASSLAFSLTFLIGMQIAQPKTEVQAFDWDDIYEEYDDVEIFKGNISIEGVTNHYGRPAVSLAIPNGMRVHDVDIDNEPHDNIEEAVVGNKIIIYGLRNGITYQNLVLSVEDFSGREFQYVINPFTVNGGGGAPVNPAPQIPQIPSNPVPNNPVPSNPIPNVPEFPFFPQGNNGNGYIGDDIEVFKGNISVVGTTNYYGRPAVSFNIPAGIKIKDIDVENEPHDHIDEAIVGNKIVVHGLRNGITYQNMLLVLEDFSGVEHIFAINPFTVNGSTGNIPNNQVPNNQIPMVPQVPSLPQGNGNLGGFQGKISIVGNTSYLGRPAVSFNIPAGINIKDIDVENEPHDHIDEAIVGNKIVVHGLRNGMNYQNLILKIEDFSGRKYIYEINPFTVNGNNNILPSVPQVPNNKIPQVQNNQTPQVPQLPNNVENETNIKNNVQNSELPVYLRNIYKNVFNREVDKGGLDYWNNKLATGQVELEDFFKNLLSEKEFLTVAPLTEDKIQKLYTGIFQREPDAGGFSFWVEKFKQELAKEGNEREALRDIIDEMTDGKEFRELLAKLGLHM